MASNRKPFPFEIVDDPVVGQELAPFMVFNDGYVRISPKKYIIFSKYRSEAENVYNMPLRSDDVFLVTFPRTGTTIMSELMYIVANDFDFEKAASKPLVKRAPYLELFTFIDNKHTEELLEQNKLDEETFQLAKFLTTPLTQLAETLPSPRTIKTHVPLSFLPPDVLDTTKVIYMARDPRDVAVSFYNLYCLWKSYSFTRDFKTFWNLFINDKRSFGPIVETNMYRPPNVFITASKSSKLTSVVYAPFFEHVKEGWEKRNHPNMLFMFYDELLKDPTQVVRKLSSFLGKQPTDEQVSQLVNHAHIDNFRKNDTANDSAFKRLGLFTNWSQPFIRKGKSGGWRDHFDEEMTLQAEQWIQHNLKDTDLRFPNN